MHSAGLVLSGCVLDSSDTCTAGLLCVGVFVGVCAYTMHVVMRWVILRTFLRQLACACCVAISLTMQLTGCSFFFLVGGCFGACPSPYWIPLGYIRMMYIYTS